FIVSVIDEMRLFLLGFIVFPFRAFLRELSMLTTFITPELAFVYASTTSTFSIAIFVFVVYCATCINMSCGNVWNIIAFDVLSFFSFVVSPSFATIVSQIPYAFNIVYIINAHEPRWFPVFLLLCLIKKIKILAFVTGQLANQNKPCVFLGYGQDELGYRLYDPIQKRLVRSRDVEFEEDQTLKNVEKAEKEIIPQHNDDPIDLDPVPPKHFDSQFEDDI
nr:retrovirus-related Pol polyprotein from transposon TNT 1-94 [Tanacetum cinerariifolium]